MVGSVVSVRSTVRCFALVLGLAACAPVETPRAAAGAHGTEASTLISGTYTHERPEIGLVFAAGRAGSAQCTGTRSRRRGRSRASSLDR
jgi:hypothetical protein